MRSPQLFSAGTALLMAATASVPAALASPVLPVGGHRFRLSLSLPIPSFLSSRQAAPVAPGVSGTDPSANVTGCPNLHILGARETTAPPGFGSAALVVRLIAEAFTAAAAGAGAGTGTGTGADADADAFASLVTTEAIDYPAIGDDKYAQSVAAGIQAVTNQIVAFSTRCPESRIVLVGYSQGSQIMDDAFCGGPDGESLIITDATIPGNIIPRIKALIWMGDPRNVPGLPYNVGNATKGGFAARPTGFKCPNFDNMIQSYCDEPDPFCAKGNDTATHQGYGLVYGQDATAFVMSKLGL